MSKSEIENGLEKNESKKGYADLMPGDRTRHNHLIIEIYRREDKFIICGIELSNQKRKKHKLWIDYDEDLRTPNRRKSLDSFKKLRDVALFTLKREQLKWAYGLLSTAIAACFISDEDENLDEYFDEASRYIEGNSRESIRSKHLIYTMSIVIPSLIIMTWFYYKIPETPDYYKLIALSAILGVVGALLSILIGSRIQQIDPFVSPRYMVIDSIARALIGMIAAPVVILLYLGDFIFTVAKGNIFLQSFISIGAGFFERLAPDLLGRIIKKEIETEDQK
ncbi:MAG: hypothetical protein ACXACY_18075 [Candidatus Hodarchaeales archaeon]|jgi:hypothetical protein